MNVKMRTVSMGVESVCVPRMHMHVFSSYVQIQLQSRRVRCDQGYEFCQVNMIQQEGMGMEGISAGVCVTDYGI